MADHPADLAVVRARNRREAQTRNAIQLVKEHLEYFRVLPEHLQVERADLFATNIVLGVKSLTRESEQ